LKLKLGILGVIAKALKINVIAGTAVVVNAPVCAFRDRISLTLFECVSLELVMVLIVGAGLVEEQCALVLRSTGDIDQTKGPLRCVAAMGFAHSSHRPETHYSSESPPHRKLGGTCIEPRSTTMII
jgi:hypothetical protein